MAIQDNPLNSPFPDYTQMIMSAIEELDEKEGSSKEAIIDYIESNYSDLSPSLATHVSHTLDKLRQTGQLLMLKDDCYAILKSSSEANGLSMEPIKRGRGRPPKPKTDAPVGVVPSSPRPRGRPPKPRDPLAPTPTKPPSSGRPRGRPRKNPQEGGPGPVPVPGPTVVGVKRGRGRPRKT
ncbi:HMG-Y-related protein A [Bienertia sinuspersici]